MTASERVKSQEGFMQRGRRTVMIATNAFGLGIDKPDIRYVMHYQSPASLEQYVQEAGRAGRDGRRANCIMLFSPEDRSIHEALLSRSRVRPEQLYRLARALSAWATEEKVPSVEALALSAELGSRTTAALLALMEEGTLVKWDPDAVFVTVPPEEFEQRARALAGQFETLRTQDARRLDAVADYAIDAECRSEFLEEYFGEDSEGACGMCDKCRGQADRPNSFWEPLAPPRAQDAWPTPAPWMLGRRQQLQRPQRTLGWIPRKRIPAERCTGGWRPTGRGPQDKRERRESQPAGRREEAAGAPARATPRRPRAAPAEPEGARRLRRLAADRRAQLTPPGGPASRSACHRTRQVTPRAAPRRVDACPGAFLRPPPALTGHRASGTQLAIARVKRAPQPSWRPRHVAHLHAARDHLRTLRPGDRRRACEGRSEAGRDHEDHGP
jgi:hypothetical protein